jgi:hypothetical protein
MVSPGQYQLLTLHMSFALLKVPLWPLEVWSSPPQTMQRMLEDPQNQEEEDWPEEDEIPPRQEGREDDEENALEEPEVLTSASVRETRSFTVSILTMVTTWRWICGSKVPKATTGPFLARLAIHIRSLVSA